MNSNSMRTFVSEPLDVHVESKDISTIITLRKHLRMTQIINKRKRKNNLKASK